MVARARFLAFLAVALAAPAFAEPARFPVHFVVITANPDAKAAATVAAFQREIDLLNEHFRSAKGERPVTFVYKSASLYADVAKSDCELVKLGDAAKKWKAYDAFKACKDPKVVDPQAIVFMVFDSWSEEKKFEDMDSMGGRAGNRPFVALDYRRLGHQIQSPEEHEMGHAFGLSHVCEPGAKPDSSTNIMSSHQDCAGSKGGLRDRGFDEGQMATIRKRIALYEKTLKPST